MDIDEIDIAIIEQLNDDGRASYREIAEAIDVSPSTVSARMRKLRHEDVLKGFKPIIDYGELGYDITAVVEVTLSSERMAQNHKEIAGHDSIVSFYEMTGEQDVIMLCKFRNREELNRLVKSTLSMDGVKGTHTRIALTKKKENDAPDLEKLKNELSQQ